MLAQSGIEYKNSHSRELLWLNCFTTTCLGGTLFARRSVRSFGEMAEPFPRASPGVPPVAMALRLGAGPAKAAPTLRSARSIFPAAHVAGKNDLDSFRLAPETRKGCPLPGPFPGGRGTKVPGRLPASVGNTCCPPGREAASAARGPLRRRDGGPPVGCLLLLKAPAVRLAAWRLCRREFLAP